MGKLQKSANDSGIYKITNLITGNFYIGSAVKFKSGLFNIPVYTIKAIKQNLIYKYIN